MSTPDWTAEIQGITFDAARTLFYLEDFSSDYVPLSDQLVDLGLELYPQEIEAARNYVFMHDLPRLNLSTWEDWSRQVLFRLSMEEPDEQIIHTVSSFLSGRWATARLYDDVVPTISELHSRGYIMSIVTTIPQFKLDPVLQPIIGYLEHVVHGGNAQCVKGNPKMYHYDLNTKLVRPGHNLFVGDEPLNDIIIPHQLGQRTARIIREGGAPDPVADVTISSLNWLLDHLQGRRVHNS